MIPIIQIAIAVAIIVLILLQERSAGLSGILGGGDSGGVYQTRRGLEKVIFRGTIVLGIVFIALAIFQFLK
ncbi:MAG: preprotein translocase subunit SecG [Candidatus Liptonbacteria bacterium]|nr:preprotein translocase subunit SecG [Candidatus Liptonbacteria bacterium]